MKPIYIICLFNNEIVELQNVCNILSKKYVSICMKNSNNLK